MNFTPYRHDLHNLDVPRPGTIYGWIHPDDVDALHYIGSTTRSPWARFAEERRKPSYDVGRWLAEIAPVVPRLVVIEQLPIDHLPRNRGGICPGLQAKEYEVIELALTEGHPLKNCLGCWMRRPRSA